MQLKPSFERFTEYARQARVVPVWTEILFDVDTAVTAYAKLAEPPFGFLLESVVGGEQWARYSFVGTQPSAAWRLRDGAVAWWTPDGGWIAVDTDDPLGDLDSRLRARTPADVPGLPRFWGGAVGYFGYDVVRQIERLPEGPAADVDVPDGLFVFTDLVLAIDNLKGRAMVMASVEVEEGMPEDELRARFDAAGARIEEMIRRLHEGAPPQPLTLRPEPEEDPRLRVVHRPRRLRSRSRAHPRLHRCGGRVPGGAEPEARHRAEGHPLPAVSGAAHAQPVAVPLLPRAGRCGPGGELTGGAGACRGRHRHRAPHRRHAGHVGVRPRRTARWRRISWPTTRSWRSTACSWIWAGTT